MRFNRPYHVYFLDQGEQEKRMETEGGKAVTKKKKKEKEEEKGRRERERQKALTSSTPLEKKKTMRRGKKTAGSFSLQSRALRVRKRGNDNGGVHRSLTDARLKGGGSEKREKKRGEGCSPSSRAALSRREERAGDMAGIAYFEIMTEREGLAKRSRYDSLSSAGGGRKGGERSGGIHHLFPSA